MIDQITNSIAASTGLTDQAVAALLTAASTSAVGLIVAIVMAPIQIKRLKARDRAHDLVLSRRIFPKILRIENYLIDQTLKRGENLEGALLEMRNDQRPESDRRDAMVSDED